MSASDLSLSPPALQTRRCRIAAGDAAAERPVLDRRRRPPAPRRRLTPASWAARAAHLVPYAGEAARPRINPSDLSRRLLVANRFIVVDRWDGEPHSRGLQDPTGEGHAADAVAAAAAAAAAEDAAGRGTAGGAAGPRAYQVACGGFVRHQAVS